MKKYLIKFGFAMVFLPKIRRKLVLAIASILLLQTFSFAQSANILLTPATSQISIGQTFTINVRVDMQSGSCNAVEVHLNFNTAFLRINSITRPASGTFSSETIPLPADTSTVNASGHLEYAAGRPSGSTSTDFDILAIVFTTRGSNPQSGTTSITLQNTPGHRTRTALNGSPLAGTLTGATVNICAAPSATISASSGAAICNSQPVALSLASATGASPYSLVVNGVTYNNVTVGSNFATIPFPTFNIFPSNPTPANINNFDGQPIEVGVKFRSTSTGFIKGIRFYKGNSVTESYTGKLYNNQTAALLASATFSPASNGWVEVLFSTPVSIAANTTYLASYYSASGRYSATDQYFCTSGGSCVGAVTNGPLTALQDNGVGGSNGVYRLGAGGGFPTNTFASANYFVDVIFTRNSNSFNLTSVTTSTGCNASGALQTINVVSADCSTLPVTLLNFSASPQGSKVMLRWATSSEINNRGFDVQRSTDGANWTTIGFVAGAGNSSSTRSYSYLDQNLEPRKYFYRLKQIDIDDRFKYSAIVSATLNGRQEFVLGQNFPNPVNNQTTIQFILPKSENVNLSLFDVSGRMVRVLVSGSKDAGTHSINVYTDNLTKGVYYYKIKAGDFTDVKKLTIQ